jgi:peptidoglycan/LPS O-acetylase OafA/YrhL
MVEGVDRDRQTFDTLNGMRGIAALAVAMMHIQWFLKGLHPVIVSVAVDFFFVLSGFVIAYAYESKLNHGLRRRDFLLARYIRLFPLFFLGLVLGAISKWLYEFPENPVAYWGNVGFNLFMLPYPLAYPSKFDNLFPLNFPAWSLFYELIAYALFAALLYTGFTEGTLDRGTWRPSVVGGLARVTFSFFMGVALHRLWQHRPMRIALHPGLLFVFLVLPLLWRPDEKAAYAWLYELAVISVWMPLMVWLGTGSVAKGAWRHVCAALGAISYPLYIIHAPIYLFVGRYDNWQGSVYFDKNAPWPALALIAVLCLVAWLAATYIDTPIRRRLSRMLLPLRSSRPTDVACTKDRDLLSLP